MTSDPSLDPDSGFNSFVQSTYSPPGSLPPPSSVEWVRDTDGTVVVDHNKKPISVSRLLATKPLRQELSTRPGPGNRKLTYISGEGVTRTLNDIFGHDGWNLDIKHTKREECTKDEKNRFHVAYTAMVRVTHRKSGAYREDCGAGDAIDRSMATAAANALKASITDAMKRAARHFGEKLGNSLYRDDFSINKAPTTLKDALDQYDKERAKAKFPPPKMESKPVVSAMPPPKRESSGTKLPAKPVTVQQHQVARNESQFMMQTPVCPPSVHRQPPIVSPPLDYNQPPPTPNQRLQSGSLFGLSTFTAGGNENQENLLPPQEFGHVRPSTANGRKSGSMTPGKRPWEPTLVPPESRKKVNSNPYVA